MKFLIVPIAVLIAAAAYYVSRPDDRPIPTSIMAAATPTSSPLAVPEARVRRQGETIYPPEPTVAPVAAPPAQSPASDDAAIPGELWSLVGETSRQQGGPSRNRMMSLMGGLAPEHAAFFLAKLREPLAKHEVQMALLWAVTAGGPAASDGLASLLDDSTVVGLPRQKTLEILNGDALDMGRLVFTDALGRTGERLAATRDPGDCAAAAGILGLKARDGATEMALRLFAENPDTDVRTSALYALAYRGTPETLEWLKNFRGRKDLDQYLLQTVDDAIARLEGR